MDNFDYSCPTKIVFGRNRTNEAGALCKGRKNVMILTGGSSAKKAGILDKVEKSLDAEGISHILFSGIQPNPDLDKVEEGRKLFLGNHCDFLLAVGGGSVIDTAKAVALALSCPDSYQMFEKVFCNYENVEAGAGIGVVLTIAASGSETGESCVISHQGRKLIGTSASCQPGFAILDPVNTLTLPPFQTAAGAADILSHLQERYFVSVRGNDLTDRYLEATMRLVIQTAVLLMKNPADLSLRESLMWAGTLAHNGILDRGRGGGDWACHMIEHELSARYPITHGEGLAMITCSWLRFCMTRETARPRLLQFARRVWGAEFPDDSENNIDYAILSQESWYRTLGLRTSLGKVENVTRDELAAIARSFCWEPGDLVKLNPQMIEAVLLDSFVQEV